MLDQIPLAINLALFIPEGQQHAIQLNLTSYNMKCKMLQILIASHSYTLHLTMLNMIPWN